VDSRRVLEAVRVRVDVGDSPALDGLSFATTGDRVLVLGAARALFEAACGLRPVAHGELHVLGATPVAAAREARVAAAPLDPRLPPRWSVRTYVFWSVRLTGRRRTEARVLAAQAMAQLAIDHAADLELGRADVLVRRSAVVAAALATGAPLLLLEDPTSNLPDDVARNFGRTIVRATEGRRTVVFAGRLPLASALATDADEALVVMGSHVAAQGAPAELAARERTVTLRVHGDCDDFARVARERGAKVSGAGPLFEVDLGEGLKVKDLLAAARDTEAVVVEVRPLARTFA
jgi:ABC-2 type transport system ATP-binding protein